MTIGRADRIAIDFQRPDIVNSQLFGGVPEGAGWLSCKFGSRCANDRKADPRSVPVSGA
jgi:hypothetical protein